MSYGANAGGAEGNHKNSLCSQFICKTVCIQTGASHIKDDNVGYHLFGLNLNSVHVSKFEGQPPGVFMIFLQPLHMMVSA